MIQKIPKHVHDTLSMRSKLYPKLWRKLNRSKKISELAAAMPIYTLGNTPHFTIPTLYVPASEVIGEGFPHRLSDFLNWHGMHAEISSSILDFHFKFSSMQRKTLSNAIELLREKNCKPQGPFDQILCKWYHNGAIGLYPSSSLSYQSGQGIVPNNAMSRSVG